MHRTNKIIAEKMKRIKESILQYEEGLITGAECLFYIVKEAADPVVSVIYRHDAEYMALCNKTVKEILALENEQERKGE